MVFKSHTWSSEASASSIHTPDPSRPRRSATQSDLSDPAFVTGNLHTPSFLRPERTERPYVSQYTWLRLNRWELWDKSSHEVHPGADDTVPDLLRQYSERVKDLVDWAQSQKVVQMGCPNNVTESLKGVIDLSQKCSQSSGIAEADHEEMTGYLRVLDGYSKKHRKRYYSSNLLDSYYKIHEFQKDCKSSTDGSVVDLCSETATSARPDDKSLGSCDSTFVREIGEGCKHR